METFNTTTLTADNFQADFRLFNMRRVNSEQTLFYYQEYMARFFRYTHAKFSDFGDKKLFTKAYERLFLIDSICNETRKKHLKVARIFADFLIENDIITNNAPRQIKPPKVTKPLPKPLEDNEIQGIYQVIRFRYSGFLAERNIMIIKTFLNS